MMVLQVKKEIRRIRSPVDDENICVPAEVAVLYCLKGFWILSIMLLEQTFFSLLFFYTKTAFVFAIDIKK